jgi:hypothetical protein
MAAQSDRPTFGDSSNILLCSFICSYNYASSTSAPPSTSSTFRHSTKINISNYPKLKEETKCRAFYGLLRFTAASHVTIDVLLPSFGPSVNSVCEAFTTLDEQKVYVYESFVDLYYDHFSAKHSATNLCQVLTLLKLDENGASPLNIASFFGQQKISI